MKLLHTPTGKPLEITDAAVFKLLKSGHILNDRGTLKTDASPGYIKYLTERNIP